MKIYVRDLNAQLIKDVIPILEKSGISATSCSIDSEPVDAVVSPANSFGNMMGGIDLYYNNHMFDSVDSKVQDKIKSEYGELKVGYACSVKTGNKDFPLLIVSPTMMIPRPISDFRDVYLACFAAIKEAQLQNVKTLAFPGMGTLTGAVPYEVFGQCLSLAFEHKDLTKEEYWEYWYKNLWKIN